MARSKSGPVEPPKPLTAEASERADTEIRHACEVLARLRALAEGVAEDVGEHNQRVEAINSDLTAAGKATPQDVIAAVDNLFAANSKMQARLRSAEMRLEKQAEQIEEYANDARTDALTGLLNRRAFDDEMAHCHIGFREAGTPFCVTMVDVDHFKAFNDKHGHQAGDKVLRSVAVTLQDAVSPEIMVARYGGEEFALIHRRSNVENATMVADSIRERIEAMIVDFNGRSLSVTASLGVAEIVRGESLEAIIDRADAALYLGKDAGRNQTCWSDGALNHSFEKMKARLELTEARASADAVASEDRLETSNRNASATSEPNSQILNRTAFCAMLGKRLAEWHRGGQVPSVLMVEVDRVDQLEQEHGSAAVRNVLRAIQRFIAASTRGMDTVGQYEPSTFALLLPGAGRVRTIGIAERLRQAISQCTLTFGAKPINFTVSLGAAEPTDREDTPTLLTRVQSALRSAQQQGGNATHFHNGDTAESLGNALRSGGRPTKPVDLPDPVALR